MFALTMIVRGALLAAVTAVTVIVVPPAQATSMHEDRRHTCGPADLTARLDRAWRTDLKRVMITLDYWPEDDRIEGRTELSFRMRPGQEQPLFHFNPSRMLDPTEERALLRTVVLDGESLDPQDDADLRLVRRHRAAEPAFERQRALDLASDHQLVITWSEADVSPGGYPGWLYPRFDDTEGPRHQTETLWPTVSSPDELVRHEIALNVHADKPYIVIGSGDVDDVGPDGDVQRWHVDSRRAISSSVMFFTAVPRDDVSSVAFDVSDVSVQIVSNQSDKRIDRAKDVAEQTINQLVDDLGPFPMPNMQILLTGWVSGMEYYGATRTGIGSLHHELGHMYFGTATVNRTWRDTWFDESAVQWLQNPDRDPLPPGFHSDIAIDRSVVAPGFDLRAYGLGARTLGDVARALGGTTEMIDFLRDLHQRRAFHPFTTDDLIADIVAAQDQLDRRQLHRWLCTSE